MRRSLFSLALLGLALATSAFGCATYRQDLDRARAHYDKNEFEPALALFRVLEPDLDSFSASELAQYAYSRGMTDFRLAALASQEKGTNLMDPKQAYRQHARHWLAVAAAIEKQTPGGLAADEKQRLDEALGELNAEVYGDPPPAGASGPAKGDKKIEKASDHSDK